VAVEWLVIEMLEVLEVLGLQMLEVEMIAVEMTEVEMIAAAETYNLIEQKRQVSLQPGAEFHTLVMHLVVAVKLTKSMLV
jgi:hypothetical protein